MNIFLKKGYLYTGRFQKRKAYVLHNLAITGIFIEKLAIIAITEILF